MSNQNSTRGYGVLEKTLARKRALMADSLIPNHLRQGRILDIGCGAFPLFLTKISFEEKFGLDKITPAIPNEEKENLITRITQDIELNPSLPFKENDFSVVTALAMIEHANPELAQKLIQEKYRILKPGGLCVLTTPAHWTNTILQTLAKIRLLSPIEIDDHKHLYSHQDLRAFLQKAGFKNEKISTGYFELGMNLWAAAEK